MKRVSVVAALLVLVSCNIDKGYEGPYDPRSPTTPATLLSLTCALDPISDLEYEGFNRPAVAYVWSGHGNLSDGSEAALDSAVVTLGSERVRKFTSTKSGSGSLDNTVTEDGDNSLSVTCYREMMTGTDTEGFGIFRLVTLTFDAIHFFSQEPNLTGTTVTMTGSRGTESVTLTDGQGSLTVRAGTNNIQIQDTDSGQLHYLEEVGAAPGEHLVFDRQNLPQSIEVTGDTGYKIVSVDSEKFLKDMAQQWTSVALAPMPGTINLVLYASGNPTCPANWTPERTDPERNTCGDITTWPPGKPFTQDQISFFLAFVQDTRDNFENPIIPWEPYQIEETLADSVSIQEHVSSVSNGFAIANVTAQNAYVVVGTGGAPFREASQSSTFGPIMGMFAASATANGNRTFQFSNEMQLFGSLVESLNYEICSVRDNELQPLLGCPFDETAPTYYEFDKNAHAVVATYLARAQTQPNPFNVRLPEP